MDPGGPDPESLYASKRFPDPNVGMARFYDDSYFQLLQGLQSGQDSSGTYQDVLRNFRGSIGDLRDFMDSPAFRMAQIYGIQNTPEWAESRDFSGFDTAFAAGAGDIARSGAEAESQGRRLAARTGMGRNAGLTAALANQAQAGASQQTASLRGQLQMQRLQQAQRAFEQQRQLAALATGQITPRVEKEDGGDETMDWLGTAAGVIGAVGSFWCWVARAVYGEDNPKWLLFRHWMLTQASPRLRAFYRRHGPWIAKVVTALPFLKRPIRCWMDRKIASLPAEVVV